MKQGERFLRDEPEKYLAVKERWLLRGITFALVGEQWRMTIKIDDKQGKHLVAFIMMSTPYDCWAYFYGNLTSTSNPMRWSVDKYYK